MNTDVDTLCEVEGIGKGTAGGIVKLAEEVYRG